MAEPATVRASTPVHRRLRLPGLQTASAVYLLIFIFVLFGLWVPDTFLTSTTFKLVLGDQVVIGMLALALLVPLTAGVFDLSVGAMLAFSLVIVAWLETNTSLNGILCCIIAVIACGAVGFISGFLLVRYRIDSFIATLGMSQVLTAATLYISDNQQMTGFLSPTFLKVGRGDLFGIPYVFYYLMGLAVVMWYVLEWTPLGRRLFASGANPEAARLTGVSTDRLVWGSLVASGMIAGVAGVIYGAKVGNFSNSLGPPLLFPAFAAVFFGATQFKPRPNVWGTIIAVYTLAFGVKGLQLAFENGVFWITPLFNGVALIVAVVLASRRGAIVRRRRRLPEPEDVGASPPPLGAAPDGPIAGTGPDTTVHG
jgi:ribose transport system permease protein